MITSINLIKALNSFPKVLGANDGDTYLHQIDVYKDYLAMAGCTLASELTKTSNQIPYVAV